MFSPIAASPAQVRRVGGRPRSGKLLVGLLVAALALVCSLAGSLLIGASSVPPAEVWAALLGAHPESTPALVVWELRVPRTIVGLLAGSALGLAGALIQALTRNPLADPGILGVNAGAGFAVTIAVGLLGISGPRGYVWFALLGAGTVTLLVTLIGSTGRGGPSPVRLTLAGVAVGAVLGGIAQGITLKHMNAFDSMRFWGVGSVGGRSLDTVWALLPFLAVGVVLALGCGRALNALALGDDAGRALGAHPGATRFIVIGAVTLLAGAATALAGPIAFVGLMVPHAVRWWTGPDQRWILAYTALLAPVLLVSSDILARVIMPSGELRVGLVTAVLGAPVLIALARRRKVSAL